MRGLPFLVGALVAASELSEPGEGGRRRWANTIGECPSLEAREEVPTSVHDLRPDDISVVMGLGDSVMAGFGAKLFALLEQTTPVEEDLSMDWGHLISEYRGISFAMGGDPHAATLPNLIRHYRADLTGASRGTHLVELCHGTICPPDEFAYRPAADKFNAAQTGATAANLGLETTYLLQQVRHNPAVNITEAWKLLTVYIGHNDICHLSCQEGGDNPADIFEQKLLANLERIRERLPRTLVAVMLLPDISQVHWFSNRHRRCVGAKVLLQIECPCAVGSEDDRWAMRLATADINKRIHEVATRMNARVRMIQSDPAKQDFAVTVIPLMKDTDLRDDIPQHFMSKLDCFHPSNTAHKSMAFAFWHSLLLPPDQRSTRLVETPQVFCPAEDDRIRI